MQDVADQYYSEKYIEMATRLSRCEQPSVWSGDGERVGACGDTVHMFVIVRDEKIARIQFQVTGCFHTLACSNAVSLLCEGRTLDEAWQLSVEEIVVFLETLPEDHVHCAELASGAFYLALANCNRRKQEGWKQAYEHAV